MKFSVSELRSLFIGDKQADRVVPPSGFTAQLTLFAAGAMAFLAVFALALSLASGRLAARWGDELARTSTIRIVAPAGERAIQTDAALRVLETTAGVESARALTDEEQQALLLPWFGAGIDLRSLPVPRLIEVVENPSGFDAEGLRLRLAAEVPAAFLDDHTRWRAPLVQAANRLRLLGWIAIFLIGAAVGAMVTLAANAALAANAQVVAVLRLVGATDRYIAEAFIRRFYHSCLYRRGRWGDFRNACSVVVTICRRRRRLSYRAGISRGRVACAIADPCDGWGCCTYRDTHRLTKSVGGA